MRNTEPITTDDQGDERHPAFGQIRVTRQDSQPGAILFDSDIRHGRTVVIEVKGATRRRSLNRDWIYEREQVVEVEMSEAQWASFVSSMGSSGVPCTLRQRIDVPGPLPILPYDPRLAHSMDEVKTAAARTFGRIEAAMAAYDALPKTATAKEKREAIDAIRNAMRHATTNVDFTSRSLVEHAENVVQRSRADIEAMAFQAAERLGLPTGTRLLELEAPTTTEESAS